MAEKQPVKGLTDREIDNLLDFKVDEKGGSDAATPRLSRTRQRSTTCVSPVYRATTEYRYSSGPNEGEIYHVNTIDYVPRDSGVEYCDDTFRNPAFSFEKWKSLPDKGGPLKLYRVGFVNDRVDTFDFANPWYIRRYGNSHCIDAFYIHDGFQINSALIPPSSDMDVSGYGPRLWSQMKPAKPTMSLGIFLGEARDLPRLLQARVDGLKTISDWYLAVKFGWEPLLADIKSMLKFVQHAMDQIDFILNNAGRPIRRKTSIKIPPQSGTLMTADGGATNWLTPAWGSFYYGGAPDYSKYKNSLTYSITKEVWGSGEFVFWFNRGRIPSRNELIGKLLGLQITPALAWELMPWSWLIDWFSNIGDVISNITVEVADNQVSRYAYAMLHTVRDYTWTATDGYLSASVTKRFESKVREKINPFGLAVDTSELSDTQKAILAALTVSKR